MKKVLAFDIDDTLNVAKTPITGEMAEILTKCLDYFEICPISGQKFDQFIRQIVDPLKTLGKATEAQLSHLHLFVAQGTQYYRFDAENASDDLTDPSTDKTTPNSAPSADRSTDTTPWRQIYNFPLTPDQVAKITAALKQAAEDLGYWEEAELQEGDEIIENRLSQVTFSALGQKAPTEKKYAWDPDCKKREQIVARAKEKAPEFDYEIGGTTSINAFTPGMNKEFGMTHLLAELGVNKTDVLYFGDMTQPGGNDYPVKQMGIDTITVRNWQDTAYALRGILGVTE